MFVGQDDNSIIRLGQTYVIEASSYFQKPNLFLEMPKYNNYNLP